MLRRKRSTAVVLAAVLLVVAPIQGVAIPMTSPDYAATTDYAGTMSAEPKGDAAVAGIGPTQAETATIDFESLPGGGETRNAMGLTDEYREQYGVRFAPQGSADHGVTVVDCAQDQFCGDARSGSMAIRGTDRTEFRNHPVYITFDEPKRYVSIYVRGEQRDPEVTVRARMVASTEENSTVDTDSREFSSHGDWTRLKVGARDGPARISRIRIVGGWVDSSYTTNFLYFDDLTFDVGDDATTVPDDTEDPKVRILSPTTRVSDERFDLWVEASDDRKLAVVRYFVYDDTGANLTPTLHRICGPVGFPCPPGDEIFRETMPITVPEGGTYTLRVEACDAAGRCSEDETNVSVELATPAELVLTGRDPPGAVHSAIVLRDAPRKELPGVEEVRLHGQFPEDVQVWLYSSGCAQFPTYCDYSEQLSVADRAANGSWINATLPDRTTIPGPERSGTFFLAVYDPGRGPSELAASWERTDEFEIRPDPSLEDYPRVWGFQFPNEGGSNRVRPNWRSFVGVFGKSAFHCTPRGTRCFFPKLLYSLYFLLYYGTIASIDGSCYGMASTSQLLATGADFSMVGQPDRLTPGYFDPDAYYPAGLSAGDCSNCTASDVREPPKPPGYGSGLIKEPQNLWAVIRSNHGVQLSQEALERLRKEHGILRRTSPTNVLERVRENPTGWVLCARGGFAEGHCVTPYAVEDVNATTSRILVYDNNYPEDMSDGGSGPPWGNAGPRYVQINRADDTFSFDRGNETWKGGGKKIYLYPLDMWGQSRHAPIDFRHLGEEGLGDLFTVTFGAADASYTSPDGGRVGRDATGRIVNTVKDAVAVPSFVDAAGPADLPLPVLFPVDRGAPTARIDARGGEYRFFASRPGRVFHLGVADAAAGATDTVQLGYESGQLASARFSPESERTEFTPLLGVAYGEREEATFAWSGLSVSGGNAVSFEALSDQRGVVYRNDAGRTTRHVLVVQTIDATAGEPVATAHVFGPFQIPDGATHTSVIADWPASSQIRSEIDLDGDGTPERSRVLSGRTCQFDPTVSGDSNRNGVPDSCEGQVPLPTTELSTTTALTSGPATTVEMTTTTATTEPTAMVTETTTVTAESTTTTTESLETTESTTTTESQTSPTRSQTTTTAETPPTAAPTTTTTETATTTESTAVTTQATTTTTTITPTETPTTEGFVK